MSWYNRLWDFQRPIVDQVLCEPNFALFAEQGTGKTIICAAVIEQLCEETSQNILLVVPLSNLRTTWERTLAQLPNISLYFDWDSYNKSTQDHRILLIHYEAMLRYDKKLTKHRWSFVGFDESQRLKSRGSRQSKIAGRIKYASRRLILTGTPFDDLTDDPQEIWAQMRFLAPQVFGTRWGDFDAQYLQPTGYMGYKRKFQAGKLEEVLNAVKPYCCRITKEVLALPPLTLERIEIPMFGRQRRIYEEMEEHMITDLTTETQVTAELVITKLVKLQQICGGFIKDDDGEINQVGRAKLRKLKSLIPQLELPVVIFCKYLEEIRQIEAIMPPGMRNVSTIIGRTRKTRDATLDAFQRNEIDVLIAQIRTGGVGIDLQRACNGVFYSSTFSYIDFDQAVSRLHRAGQTRPVKFFLLGVQNTVDMEIYNALLSKQSISELILNRFQSKRRRPTVAKEKAEKAEKKEKKDVPAFKYTITDLADALEIEPAGCRVKLRRLGIPKATSGRYGWNTKAEFNEVVSDLKKSAKKSKKAKNEDEE